MTVTGVCISVKVNGKLTGRNQALVSLLIKLEHHAMTHSEVKVWAQYFKTYGTMWKRVVNHTFEPLYTWAKSPWDPLYRMLSGPSS